MRAVSERRCFNQGQFSNSGQPCDGADKGLTYSAAIDFIAKARNPEDPQARKARENFFVVSDNIRTVREGVLSDTEKRVGGCALTVQLALCKFFKEAEYIFL